MISESSTRGWHVNYAYFINSSSSWLVLGGYYGDGTNAGVLNFNKNHGSRNYYGSVRGSLAPTK